MIKFGWGKSTDLLHAVQNCVIQHLTAAESLAILESQGFKMTQSKLDKIKKYLRASIDERIDHIVNYEYRASYIASLDTMQLVNSRWWEIATERKGRPDELKALEQIPQNIKILEGLYDSSIIYASLSNKLARKTDDDVS